jgi:hypothetical protein
MASLDALEVPNKAVKEIHALLNVDALQGSFHDLPASLMPNEITLVDDGMAPHDDGVQLRLDGLDVPKLVGRLNIAGEIPKAYKAKSVLNLSPALEWTLMKGSLKSLTDFVGRPKALVVADTLYQRVGESKSLESRKGELL